MGFPLSEEGSKATTSDGAHDRNHTERSRMELRRSSRLVRSSIQEEPVDIMTLSINNFKKY